MWQLDLGANRQTNGEVKFKIWAPYQKFLNLKIEGQIFPMEKDEKGYFSIQLSDIENQTLYSYAGESGEARADPVSRYLPEGPFGPSMFLDSSFNWKDQQWQNIEQEKLIFYECHIGTFTPEGTFQAAIKKIPYLKELGITCLELMPVNQFPGKFNWGYDGVNLFAPQNSYGKPEDLKELINQCHKAEIAVCLDVVYNHFGPEGCFLHEFGPYQTKKYQTAWGNAVNFDDAYSDEVRHFFIQNALYWVNEFHVDALRLDALHAIYDFSAFPFLRSLTESIQKEKRKIYLIGESDLNDSKLIKDYTKGGYALNALWHEDFHHALHVTLTGAKDRYYQDFNGIKDLEKAIVSGPVYQGKYSKFRKRNQGNSFRGIDKKKLVSFLQNHDQIGNSSLSNRIDISFEDQKLGALILILSPYLPLIFMGQEYGEESPFSYFIDFQDRELFKNVCNGRLKELKNKDLLINSREDLFLNSKLKWNFHEEAKQHLLHLYRSLIKLRKNFHLEGKISSYSGKEWLVFYYPSKNTRLGIGCNFSQSPYEIPLKDFTSEIKIILHTDQSEFGGTHAPVLQHSAIYCPQLSGVIFQY